MTSAFLNQGRAGEEPLPDRPGRSHETYPPTGPEVFSLPLNLVGTHSTASVTLLERMGRGGTQKPRYSVPNGKRIDDTQAWNNHALMLANKNPLCVICGAPGEAWVASLCQQWLSVTLTHS